ncbi:MAG: DUF3137 domain-containing protein [Candidatus Omnitrophota bacterium]
MAMLRKLFGPSKDEVWKKLCQEIGAEFIEGGSWSGGKVIAKADDWTITLDTHRIDTQHDHIFCTRMRAPFVNKDGFYFSIYRKGIFDAIGKLLGMQDVPVGDEEFDRDFIIKGNNETKVKALFSDPKIRELIKAQPSFYFEVKADGGWFEERFPEGVDELYFLVDECITNIERLEALYKLFAATLHQLCHIGSAYENDPNIHP